MKQFTLEESHLNERYVILKNIFYQGVHEIDKFLIAVVVMPSFPATAICKITSLQYMKADAGKKPYRCKICDAQYTQRDQKKLLLQLFIRRIEILKVKYVIPNDFESLERLFTLRQYIKDESSLNT